MNKKQNNEKSRSKTVKAKSRQENEKENRRECQKIKKGQSIKIYKRGKS